MMTLFCGKWNSKSPSPCERHSMALESVLKLSRHKICRFCRDSRSRCQDKLFPVWRVVVCIVHSPVAQTSLSYERNFKKEIKRWQPWHEMKQNPIRSSTYLFKYRVCLYNLTHGGGKCHHVGPGRDGEGIHELVHQFQMLPNSFQSKNNNVT